MFLDSSNALLGTTLDPSVGTVVDSSVQAAPTRAMVFHPAASTAALAIAAMSRPDTQYSTTAGAAARGGTGIPTVIDPEELFLSSFNRSLLVGVLVGGLVALALAVALSRGIVRSIAALTAAARGMANGHLDQRVTVRQGGEIGELGHAFNAMAEG